MEIIKQLTHIENSCIALGFFDGVHIGHKVLINDLIQKSKELGSPSVVLTFQTSPAEMFFDNVKYLTTNPEKEKLISDFGVDYIIEIDFNKELSDLSASDYLENILYEYFKPKYIVTGFNHTFGHNKAGNSEFLKANQNKYGYKYNMISPVKYDNTVVSSTAVRECLESADIPKANKLLGYDYSFEGVVIEGNRLGRTIGFPTANIIYPEGKVNLPYGAYSASVRYNDTVYKSVLNYGIKPTVNLMHNTPIAEAHILGFDKDIYGEKLKVSIHNLIRYEKKFNSMDELKYQINEDIKKC